MEKWGSSCWWHGDTIPARRGAGRTVVTNGHSSTNRRHIFLIYPNWFHNCFNISGNLQHIITALQRQITGLLGLSIRLTASYTIVGGKGTVIPRRDGFRPEAVVKALSKPLRKARGYKYLVELEDGVLIRLCVNIWRLTTIRLRRRAPERKKQLLQGYLRGLRRNLSPADDIRHKSLPQWIHPIPQWMFITFWLVEIIKYHLEIVISLYVLSRS